MTLKSEPYFDSWSVPLEAIRFETDWWKHCPHRSNSAEVSFADSDHIKFLSLFESSNVSTVEDDSDFVSYTGGPCWALKWCPAKEGNTSYLAIGCHPDHSPRTLLNTVVNGPGILQIWAVSPRSPPFLALGIIHDGGLTWDVSWCPGAHKDARLGLLAAALGDGGVRIWAVPTLSSASSHGEGQPMIHLPVVASIHEKHLSGSKPCIVDWLPAVPHDLLLIGCWDGSAVIVQLQPQPSMEYSSEPYDRTPRQMSVIAHFPAEVVPLRSLKWIPPSVCSTSLDRAERHLFLSAGHEGCVKVWDYRQQFEPAFSQSLTTLTVLGAAWSTNPLGIIAALEDGNVRGIPLEPDGGVRSDEPPRTSRPNHSLSWRGEGRGALWGIDVHESSQLVAYGGEDGEVGVFKVHFERSKSKHVAVGGFQKTMLALRVRTADELASSKTLYHSKRGANGTRKELPDGTQAIHRVAWGPACGESIWLAYAGAAGLLRTVLAMQTQAFGKARPTINRKASRGQTVRVFALQDSHQNGFKSLAIGLATAALVAASPVDAKVILVQPEVKNFVKGTSPAPAKKTAASKGSQPTAGSSEGFDIKPLVLPISIVSIVGGAFVLNTVDPGFFPLMEELGAFSKDSTGYAGYETALKDTPFYGGSGSIAAKGPAAAKKKSPFGKK